MYTDGSGIEKDPAKAYQWLTLSANQNELTAVKLLVGLERTLTPEQMAEGKRLAAEWKERTGKSEVRSQK
jgi:uncharacterized protein